jgi:hypothetical protein
MSKINPMLGCMLFCMSILGCVDVGYGQREKDPPRANLSNVGSSSSSAKFSPAYAEVLLRQTELQADLESLLVEYTEDYPKVKETKVQFELINKETERLLAVKSADAAKLTAALGKLIVRKVELQGELWKLQQQFGDAHPDVKRGRRKVEIFENAIKEILG